MDMRSQFEVEINPIQYYAMRGEIRNVAPARRNIDFNSIASEDGFESEARELVDDIRLALSSDLSLATKMVARLSALLAREVSRHQRLAPVRGGLAAWQMEKVRNYIKGRLDKPLLIEDLAKLISISTSYFCRSFKSSFGEPPHAYVMRMRIEHAQALMMATTESLSQIALACGLVDQSHLCRCFRKITGATPGAWRRRTPPGSVSGHPGALSISETPHRRGDGVDHR